jgi:hypothetical protein
VLHQQPEGQLQMQHNRRQDNKKQNNNNQIIINYMAVEKVNIQMQLVTEYINIFGTIIQLNSVNLVKRRRKLANKYKQTRH